MIKLHELTKEEATFINGGTLAGGVEFFGICAALFIAGWEVGRGIAREVKSWF